LAKLHQVHPGIATRTHNTTTESTQMGVELVVKAESVSDSGRQLMSREGQGRSAAKSPFQTPEATSPGLHSLRSEVGFGYTSPAQVDRFPLWLH
jgi:hypothetical protein